MRIRTWAALAFAGLIGAASALGAFPTAPAKRIVAVGDLHGDFAAWRAILGDAGLIDAKGHWRGGTSVLVQTGDVVDRAPDSLPIIDDLIRLHGEAKHAGGQVIALIGNHEAMVATGDLRYVDPGERRHFVTPNSAALRDRAFASVQDAVAAAARAKVPGQPIAAIRVAWEATLPLGQIEYQMAWRPDGRLGHWLLGNKALAIVDGNLFVHGGLAPTYAAKGIEALNRQIVAEIRAGRPDGVLIEDENGPLWNRAYARGTAPTGDLEKALAAVGAKRMVIAHTPDLKGIVLSPNGKLARIDSGISRAYGGTLSWLEIHGDQLTPHTVRRPPAK